MSIRCSPGSQQAYQNLSTLGDRAVQTGEEVSETSNVGATNNRLTGEANRLLTALSAQFGQTKTQVVRHALTTYSMLLTEVSKGVNIRLVDERSPTDRDLILPR